MDIGRDRDFQFRADRRENFTAFLDADAAIRTDRRAVRLVVRRLENEWDRFRLADFRDPPRHPPDKLFRLDHARAEDEDGLPATDLHVPNVDAPCLHGKRTINQNPRAYNAHLAWRRTFEGLLCGVASTRRGIFLLPFLAQTIPKQKPPTNICTQMPLMGAVSESAIATQHTWAAEATPTPAARTATASSDDHFLPAFKPCKRYARTAATPTPKPQSKKTLLTHRGMHSMALGRRFLSLPHRPRQSLLRLNRRWVRRA